MIMLITTSVRDTKLEEIFQRELTEEESQQIKTFITDQVRDFIDDIIYELPEMTEDIFI
jgi:cell division septum initiation protein DivIVA